jgi:hypothetical protein
MEGRVRHVARSFRELILSGETTKAELMGRASQAREADQLTKEQYTQAVAMIQALPDPETPGKCEEQNEPCQT